MMEGKEKLIMSKQGECPSSSTLRDWARRFRPALRRQVYRPCSYNLASLLERGVKLRKEDRIGNRIFDSAPIWRKILRVIRVLLRYFLDDNNSNNNRGNSGDFPFCG